MDKQTIDSLKRTKLSLAMLLELCGLMSWPIILSGSLGLILFASSFYELHEDIPTNWHKGPYLVTLLAAGSLLSFIGKALCCTVPRTMPGRSMIYLVMILEITVMICFTYSYFNTVSLFFTLSAISLHVLAYLCFFVFLKLLANFTQSHDLIQKATRLIKWGIILVMVVLLVLVVARTGLGSEMPLLRPFIALLALSQLIIGVTLVSDYLTLLLDFRRATR